MSTPSSLKGDKHKGGSFTSMGLDANLLKGLSRIGYTLPTPVQRKTLPVALAGLDVVCMSRTGSGKTCAFVLPMIQKLKEHNSASGVRAVILSPTRELAVQTFKVTKDMAKFTTLRVASIVGGDSIDGQFDSLANNPDIIVATPGRLMHHLREISTFTLKNTKYLVFDEADRLFEMGFAEQLNEIVKHCATERQTLLFSATMPKQLVQFTRAGLRDPEFIRLETDVSLSAELRVAFFSTRSNEKLAALLYLIRRIIPVDHFSIIFTATKHHSELIHFLLQKIGVPSTLVYGSMDQDSRSLNLKQFRNGEVRYLIVTDVAARGLDIPLINNVIHFHCPSSPKLFVHRCGRAARQGRIGFAFALVDSEEMAYVVDIHNFLAYDVHASMNVDRATASYTLDTMTPKDVHTGLIPQDALDEENEYLRQCLHDDYALMKLNQVAENGFIQYKKTRQEATRDGVKGAKNIVKSESLQCVHPLIQGMDLTKNHELLAKKQDYVKMLQTFRPSQTVLETGIGTSSKSSGLRNSSVKHTSHTVEVMHEFRKVTASALERNKYKHADVANDDENGTNKNDDEGDFGDDNDEFTHDDDNIDENEEEEEDREQPVQEVKQRLSKADRKKMKKLNLTGDALVSYVREKKRKEAEQAMHIQSAPADLDDEKRFQDSAFFMDYGNQDEHSTYVESALQPMSGLRGSEAHTAALLESAMLDLTPESAVDINKKKKLLRWDAKKRKFVKQTLEEMSSAKKIRSEVGSGMKSSSSKPQGEMYEKWKKKRRREISSGVGEDEDDRPNPNFKHNTKVKSELKDRHQIRKEKEKREKNQFKNLEKGKRNSIILNRKKKKN